MLSLVIYLEFTAAIVENCTFTRWQIETKERVISSWLQDLKFDFKSESVGISVICYVSPLGIHSAAVDICLPISYLFFQLLWWFYVICSTYCSIYTCNADNLPNHTCFSAFFSIIVSYRNDWNKEAWSNICVNNLFIHSLVLNPSSLHLCLVLF